MTEVAANLSLPPGVYTKGLKILWGIVQTVATGLLFQQYDHYAEIQPAPATPEDPPATEWRRLSIRTQTSVAGDASDDQYFSLDIVNYTNGLPDSSWTDSDYSLVNTNVLAFLDSVTARMWSGLTIKELRYYAMAFNPYTDANGITITKPFVESGPPVRIFPISKVGGAAGSLPPQCCTAITELTPARPHWGRFYLPTLSSSVITTAGRISTTSLQGIVDAADAMIEGLASLQFVLVVPTLQAGSVKGSYAPKRTLQAVTGVKADDVVDIQRRRRFQHPLAQVVPTP